MLLFSLMVDALTFLVAQCIVKQYRKWILCVRVLQLTFYSKKSKGGFVFIFAGVFCFCLVWFCFVFWLVGCFLRLNKSLVTFLLLLEKILVRSYT